MHWCKDGPHIWVSFFLSDHATSEVTGGQPSGRSAPHRVLRRGDRTLLLGAPRRCFPIRRGYGYRFYSELPKEIILLWWVQWNSIELIDILTCKLLHLYRPPAFVGEVKPILGGARDCACKHTPTSPTSFLGQWRRLSRRSAVCFFV